MIWKKSSGGMPNALMSPFCTALDTLPRRASLYRPWSTWILATGICGLLSLASLNRAATQCAHTCYFSTVGLHLRDAAIDEQFRSRDIAAVVGSEKDDGLRNLVGRSEPAERHEVGHRLAALLACA